MQNAPVDRPRHGHHKVAASIFAASLIVGAALVLSAELMKPARYEFHSSTNASQYVIYDTDTGRAASVDFHTSNPIESLAK
jgi:hypothetical protein